MRIFRTLVVLAVAVTSIAVGAGQARAAENDDHQLLFFNHAYGVFDRVTADAIEHSTYLRDFASFEVRTTTGSQGTWTGRYVYGEHTYLELFGAGDLPAPDDTFGSAGMGVSVERSSQLATVVDRLRADGVANPLTFTQTRDFGDGTPPVPWFDGVFTTDQYDKFGAWGMEYRPEYFADPRANKTEPPSFPGDVSRERYLPDDYQKHLMRDVTRVRIAVTARDLANTTPLLRAGGFAVRTIPSGVVATCGGTTIQLDTVPVGEAGMRGVEFSLNHPVATQHREQIGRSTLVVGPGNRAVWTFPSSAV
ncbi:DUF5829 family protein [Fodinicola acaciae]|uniref:DUF5829 family protein n=1 Tax=Fodinicola acaciae TaxID=2681555 RepID=UPI0013D3C051|nr:DUF5829 family protein [Fodinicola acaciae]